MSEFTHDDICAAWLVQQHTSLQSALEQAPDAETEDMVRHMWKRGKEVLETHTAHVSGSFPFGADPQGGRLDEFVRANGIVVWTETSAGYVATAAQVCYMGLAERSDPNNTRARSDAFQQAARALLEETSFDLNEGVDYAALVPMLIERTGCHSDTAKRHLAKAARLMRGEAAAAWGGSRPGAGRPAERRDS